MKNGGIKICTESRISTSISNFFRIWEISMNFHGSGANPNYRVVMWNFLETRKLPNCGIIGLNGTKRWGIFDVDFAIISKYFKIVFWLNSYLLPCLILWCLPISRGVKLLELGENRVKLRFWSWRRLKHQFCNPKGTTKHFKHFVRNLRRICL